MDFSIILPFGLYTIYTLSSYMLQFLFHVLPTYLSIAYRGLNGRRPSLREDLRALPLMVVLLQIKFVNESAGQPTGVYPLADREPERPAAQPSSLHAWLSAVYSILDQHILRRGTA
jgi:hypothetical protein